MQVQDNSQAIVFQIGTSSLDIVITFTDSISSKGLLETMMRSFTATVPIQIMGGA